MDLTFAVVVAWSARSVARHAPLLTGMAVYPDDGQVTDTVMRNADLALYAAKRRVHAHAPAVTRTGVTARNGGAAD